MKLNYPHTLLPKEYSLDLWRAGGDAFREVPGLKGYLSSMLGMTYVIFLGVGLTGLVLLYQAIVEPVIGGNGLLSHGWEGAGFWLGLVGFVIQLAAWLFLVLLLGAVLLLSFVLSLALSGLWFDGLVARVAAHFRPVADPPPPLSWGRWWAGAGYSLQKGGRQVMLSLLSLLMGFIPVAGLAAVVLINGFLLGREIREPYLNLLESQGGDPRSLRAGLGWWTVQTGLLPVGVALVPVAGWLALPYVMARMTTGYAYLGEQRRQEGTK